MNEDRPELRNLRKRSTARSDPQVGERIKIGISSCLLGQEVRFDRGHKRDSYINGTLGLYFDFVPVCPEMAIGLGTPREPIRLVGDAKDPRAVGTRNADRDVTDALRQYGRHMGGTLSFVSGYLLKRASPSCGMERVKVYEPHGMPAKQGVGIYAKALMEVQPLLPVEEEGRLGDPVLRENFIERVFVYHRWQRVMASGITAAKLVDFHSDHKLLIMAHSQETYKQLGQLIAQAGSQSLEDLTQRYISVLMNALKVRVKRKQHVNVLQHLLGYLKTSLDTADKAELLESFEAYRNGLLPLIVPLTLLKHHFRKNPNPYIQRQVYLSPHPAELMLRNFV